MFKKIISILFVSIFFVSSSFYTVSAKEASRVCDDIDVLTYDEETELNEQIQLLADETGFNILIAFVDNVYGKTPRVFAADYYENIYGHNSDGIVFLVALESRDLAIAATHDAEPYFSNVRIDNMLADIAPYLSDEEYLSACEQFLYNVDTYYSKGTAPPMENIEPDSDYSGTISFSGVGYGLLFGFIIALITCGFIKAKYSKHPSPNTNAYLDSAESGYKIKDDDYIRSYTTSHYIGSSSSSGGRSSGGGGSSSSFHSSSGSSFNGGSSKF